MLRIGYQWNALSEIGLYARSASHCRFQEWVEADVFVALWGKGLVGYDALQGINWGWLAMDARCLRDKRLTQESEEASLLSRLDAWQCQTAACLPKVAYRRPDCQRR